MLILGLDLVGDSPSLADLPSARLSQRHWYEQNF